MCSGQGSGWEQVGPRGRKQALAEPSPGQRGPPALPWPQELHLLPREKQKENTRRLSSRLTKGRPHGSHGLGEEAGQ